MSAIKWHVYGKHPKFPDFFSIGNDTQFAVAYKKWVTQGFEKYINNQGCHKQTCSYRFWNKGDSAETLAPGLLRSSVDSLGRPFPLLFIGTAVLPCWQKQWDDLDKLLDETWVGLEKIAGDGHVTLQDISADLEKISFPVLSKQCLQQTSGLAPNAFFTGGCGGEITMVRFTNPLTTQDFFRLWCIKSASIS